MLRAKRQTTINDHFSPSQKYNSRPGTQRRIAPRRYVESESEGSDGIANIRLTQKASPEVVESSEEEEVIVTRNTSPQKRELQRLQKSRLRRPNFAPRMREVDISSDGEDDDLGLESEASFLGDGATSEESSHVERKSTGKKHRAAETRRLTRGSRAGAIAPGKAAPTTSGTRHSGRTQRADKDDSSKAKRGTQLDISPPPSSTIQVSRPLRLIPYVEVPSRAEIVGRAKSTDERPTTQQRVTRTRALERVGEGDASSKLPPPSSRLSRTRKAVEHESRSKGALKPTGKGQLSGKSFTTTTTSSKPDRTVIEVQVDERAPRLDKKTSVASSSTGKKRQKSPSTSSETGRQALRVKDAKKVKAEQKSARISRGKERSTVKSRPTGSASMSENSDEDDIELDEPERFKTATRFRNKTETPFQRRLRKLKSQRQGIQEISTDDEETEDESESEDDEDDEEDFIEQDGGKIGDVALPHQFSLDSAQTPEFKFKVVFHYMVMLNVHGPKFLPLRGDAEEYIRPQLEHLRRMMAGHRDARVRSQIWRSEFVQVLQKYPNFVETYDHDYKGDCDVCHIAGRVSSYEVSLEGLPYDRESHQILEEAVLKDSDRKRSRQSAGSEDTDDSEDDLPRKFYMGRFCKARSQVYHAMSHWEDVLYHRVREYYKDLLRALDKPLPSDSEASSSDVDSDEPERERANRRARRDNKRAETAGRISQLRSKILPSTKDVDKITEWMDVTMGYQAKDFRWFNDIITRSERLEKDKRTD